MTNKINLTAIVVTVLVIIGAIGLVLVYFGMSAETQTVSAAGEYTINVESDKATINFAIETRSKDAETAKNDNAAKQTLIVVALKKLGYEEVQTVNFNIYPEYDWTSSNRKVLGYTATHSMKLETSDFTKVGEILNAIVDNGGLVNNIDFGLSDAKNEQYRLLALGNASENSLKKAEAVANGLGKQVDELVSVESSNYDYLPYPIMYEAAKNADVANVNINPTELTVSAQVTAVYSIK